MKICRETQNCAKIEQKISNLHEDLSSYVYKYISSQRHEFAAIASLCNTQYFYIGDSNM